MTSALDDRLQAFAKRTADEFDLVRQELAAIPSGPVGATGATGPEGPVGPQGPQGEEGPQGTITPELEALATSVAADALAAENAEAAAVAAQDAAELAQTAAEAAQASAEAASASAIAGIDNFFASTAAGLSGTVSGDYFAVPSTVPGELSIIYLNDSGVAVEVKRTPGVVFAVEDTDALEHAIVDDDGRVAFGIRATGEAIMPKAEIQDLRIVDAEINREIGFRQSAAAALDPVSFEVKPGSGFGIEDNTGRQALRLMSDRLEAPAFIRTVELNSRGRSAGSDTHVVVSRRRSASSQNFDLYSVNIATGAEAQLTSDVSDKWDFCDPAIVGTQCVYTRRAGGVQKQFARPLDASTAAKPLLPERYIVTNGDSLVNVDYVSELASLTALPLYDISVGGTSFAQQVAHLTARTDLRSGIYVLWEGGINPEADIPNNVIAKIQEQVDMLTPYAKRWCVVSPLPGSARLGDAGRQVGNPAHYDAQVAAIEAAFPNNFVPLLAALQAENDGSPTDLADVAGDAVPTSLLADAIHLNTAGSEIAAGLVKDWLSTKGWL